MIAQELPFRGRFASNLCSERKLWIPHLDLLLYYYKCYAYTPEGPETVQSA